MRKIIKVEKSENGRNCVLNYKQSPFQVKQLIYHPVDRVCLSLYAVIISVLYLNVLEFIFNIRFLITITKQSYLKTNIAAYVQGGGGGCATF